MTRARGPRYSALALVFLGMACGDVATAPNVAESAFVVSLTGVSAEHAGVVLHLTDAVTDIAPADPSLEVAWAHDGANAATVVVVGSLAATRALLVVRRRGGLEPLRAVVRELAGADGSVSSSSPAYAIVRAAGTS